MSVLSFTIFAIVFGIIVDRMEHIIRITNTILTYQDNTVPAPTNSIEDNFTFDECITANCVHWCRIDTDELSNIPLMI